MRTERSWGGVLGPPRLIRLEGAAAAVLGLFLYEHHGDSWWLLVALVLVPDLSIPVYFIEKRVGAALYNLVHTYLWAAILAGIGIGDEHPLLVSLAIIWLIHIGVDRALGYGLKYPTDFKDTHLQRL
ncbi:MAG: DUF4260 domain-containing protein [Actinomycetota bacterium]